MKTEQMTDMNDIYMSRNTNELSNAIYLTITQSYSLGKCSFVGNILEHFFRLQ